MIQVFSHFLKYFPLFSHRSGFTCLLGVCLGVFRGVFPLAAGLVRSSGLLFLNLFPSNPVFQFVIMTTIWCAIIGWQVSGMGCILQHLYQNEMETISLIPSFCGWHHINKFPLMLKLHNTYVTMSSYSRSGSGLDPMQNTYIVSRHCRWRYVMYYLMGDLAKCFRNSRKYLLPRTPMSFELFVINLCSYYLNIQSCIKYPLRGILLFEDYYNLKNTIYKCVSWLKANILFTENAFVSPQNYQQIYFNKIIAKNEHWFEEGICAVRQWVVNWTFFTIISDA